MRILLLILLTILLSSCMTIRNVTEVYVMDSNGTRITCDGGSQSKPVSVPVNATIPASALAGAM